MMRFEEAYGGWRERSLTQEEAARILGVTDRTFRRYVERYEDSGLDGLVDRRLNQVSHRRAPVDEVLAVEEMYRSRYDGWNAKHFFSWYKRQGGNRSYTWAKKSAPRGETEAQGPEEGGASKAPRALSSAGDAHTPVRKQS